LVTRSSQRKEIALKVLNAGVELRVHAGCANQAEDGVQLVHVPVRFDTRIGLRHPGAIEQRGFAGIARPCIDFHGGIIGGRTSRQPEIASINASL
jgi:hypothetical protein